MVLYSAMFMVMLLGGGVLSVVMGYVVRDFVWGFVRLALMHSLLLGAGLIGSSALCQRLVGKASALALGGLSLALLLGVGVIGVLAVLWFEPALFIYAGRGAAALLFVNSMVALALQILMLGTLLHRHSVERSHQALSRQRALTQAMEHQLLLSKVNPHFLFNTLNLIVNLLKQPALAEQALLNLADLLRHNLEQSHKERISCSEELENVKKYLHIQQLRFGPRLSYTIEGGATALIPPLVIQPLVENCIKHNLERVEQLHILIRLTQHKAVLHIEVVDSAATLQAAMVRTGGGLVLTKKRVENSGGRLDFLEGGVTMVFTL
jgi:sensor histidine kinase YesM